MCVCLYIYVVYSMCGVEERKRDAYRKRKREGGEKEKQRWNELEVKYADKRQEGKKKGITFARLGAQLSRETAKPGLAREIGPK